MLLRKILERSIGFSVVFHKNQIPNLNNVWMIFIDQFRTRDFSFFFFTAKIDMNLTRRPTRSLFTHFPKVVFFVTHQNTVFGNNILPNRKSFSVHAGFIAFVTLKNSYIKNILVYFIHLSEQFPSPRDGFLFEIISKTPIAQHLEKRMMVCVITHLFQVIVFARNAQTFLGIGNSFAWRLSISDKIFFKWCHSRVDKHQG